MSEVKQYDNNNTGIIGKNDYATTDKHPNKKGRCKIKGLWFWVSAWDKESKGREFMSLSFTEMTAEEAEKAELKAAAKQAPQQGGDWGTQGASQQQQPQQQQPLQAQTPSGAAHPSNNPPPQDFDDEIPF